MGEGRKAKERKDFLVLVTKKHPSNHGLRTPNEGLNQRILKIWADVGDKICLGGT